MKPTLATWFAPGAGIAAASILVGAVVLHDRHASSVQTSAAAATTHTAARGVNARQPAAPPASAAAYTGLLDPSFSLGAAPTYFALDTRSATSFAFAEPATPAAPTAPATPIASKDDALEVAEAEPTLPLPAVPETALDIPMPTPRPPALRLPPVAAPTAGSERGFGRRLAIARAAAAVAPDQRSFFDKLFGVPQTPGPVLAYASPEDGLFHPSPARSIPVSQATAIYDISAHTVYLPSGARLEAHSGLREKIDDPRFVAQRMQGPTPPAIYELTPREALFHGVRALRLNPIGGGTTFGRSGLLAHTYMLGPSGQSNGCVSFRNYNAFLQAYDRGEVRRLVVVAHL